LGREKVMYPEILTRSKTKALIITQLGAGVAILEILLRFFSIDTNNYVIFSFNLHWFIIFYLVALNTELGGFKKYSRENRETTYQDKSILEDIFIGLANMLSTVFAFVLVIVLYSTLGMPSGEILFQEENQALILDGHIFRVVSVDSFYMYKHYRYILGLSLLLIVYFKALIPLAKEIKESK